MSRAVIFMPATSSSCSRELPDQEHIFGFKLLTRTPPLLRGKDGAEWHKLPGQDQELWQGDTLQIRVSGFKAKHHEMWAVSESSDQRLNTWRHISFFWQDNIKDTTLRKIEKFTKDSNFTPKLVSKSQFSWLTVAFKRWFYQSYLL